MNREVNRETLTRAVDSVRRRSQHGYQFQNVAERLYDNPADVQRAIVRQLVPNLAVEQEVAIAPPVTLKDVERTREVLADPNFSVEVSDPKAVIHVLDAIAKDNGLNMVLVPEPSPAVVHDSCNKATDFAMANDTITENSLFLLGSSCQEHETKGISLHLNVDYDALEADPSAKARFMTETKVKLARIHNVRPEDIVIVSFTKD
jgi:hypothetical protein